MRMAFLLASADVQSADHFVLLIGAPVDGDQQDAMPLSLASFSDSTKSLKLSTIPMT